MRIRVTRQHILIDLGTKLVNVSMVWRSYGFYSLELINSHLQEICSGLYPEYRVIHYSGWPSAVARASDTRCVSWSLSLRDMSMLLWFGLLKPSVADSEGVGWCALIDPSETFRGVCGKRARTCVDSCSHVFLNELTLCMNSCLGRKLVARCAPSLHDFTS